MIELLGITKDLIDINYTPGVTIKAKYIVIHETDNVSIGANAKRNRDYFANHKEAEASAHFIVDKDTIIQCLELNQRGWHVGDNKNYSDITNDNSIGIEICVNSDGDYDLSRANAIELTKYLMNELEIDKDHVVRHNDASGKYCPRYMLDYPYLWEEFRNKLDVSETKNYLSLGDTGHSVEEFQHKLEKVVNAKFSQYGAFDQSVNDAVVYFQTEYGLVPDGEVGPYTMSIIDEKLAAINEYQIRVFTFTKKEDAEKASQEFSNLGYYNVVEEI
jgi:N-acetylmuramoyl-L-alanine amidase CwlA